MKTNTPRVPRTLLSKPNARAEARSAKDRANAGMATRPVRVSIGSRVTGLSQASACMSAFSPEDVAR